MTTNFGVSDDEILDNLIVRNNTTLKNVNMTGTVNITGITNSNVVSANRLRFIPIDSTGPFIFNSIFGNNQIHVSNGVPSPVMTVTLNTSLLTFAFIVFYQARATDGVDVQSRVGSINFVGINKGGLMTSSSSTTNGPSAVSAGTLTVTSSVTTLGTTATLNMTVTSAGLGPLTLEAVDLVVIAQSADKLDNVVFFP